MVWQLNKWCVNDLRKFSRTHGNSVLPNHSHTQTAPRLPRHPELPPLNSSSPRCTFTHTTGNHYSGPIYLSIFSRPMYLYICSGTIYLFICSRTILFVNLQRAKAGGISGETSSCEHGWQVATFSDLMLIFILVTYHHLCCYIGEFHDREHPLWEKVLIKTN